MLIAMTESGILFKTRFNYIKQQHLSFFAGWQCEIGTHGVIINKKGLIKRSVCRNVGTTCAQRNCWCSNDIEIPKAINPDTLDNFRSKVLDAVATVGSTENFVKQLEQYDKEIHGKLVALGWLPKILNELFLLDWNIFSRCNFDCSYCPPRIHDLTSPYPDLEELKFRLTSQVKLPVDRIIKVMITGGEPTLYPHILEFIDWVKEITGSNYIEILTNGTAKVQKLIQLHENCNLRISIHEEFTNQKLLDKIVDFVQTTPHKRLVAIKFFENADMMKHKDFVARIKDFPFVDITTEVPIVNKDTGVWNNEN